MYLGLDLGTSSLKVVAVDDRQMVVAAVSETYPTLTPQPGWAEQAPAHWIEAASRALRRIVADCPAVRSDLKAIGLSGQMHTLVALGSDQKPLRTAILWNDIRGADFVRDALHHPSLQAVTGVGPMTSFTAAKLHWLKNAEPDTVRALHTLLLPKDYLRFWLTGEVSSEPSDAAGTQMFDQAARIWSKDVLELLGVPSSVMPPLTPSHQVVGRLRGVIAAEFGLPEVPVVAGGGDAATGALGVGCVDETSAIISLGTGSIYLAGASAYRPAADPGIHVFAHCLPARWYRMGALLSCGSAVDWAARLTGFATTAEALTALEARGWNGPGNVISWPHLDGRRAVGQAAQQRGSFAGMHRATSGLDVVQAVLEGVCFALAQIDVSLSETGPLPETLTLIGGGGRSRLWAKMLATTLGRPLCLTPDVGAGSAIGAVRLAMLGTGYTLDDMAVAGHGEIVEPGKALQPVMRERLAEWNRVQNLQ